MPFKLSAEEEQVNALLYETKILESTYSELTTRQSMLERMLLESRASLDTIREIGSSPSEEVLIPVGAGVLLRTAPPKVDKVLVNIGANVVMEKTKEEAEKIMETRAKELEETVVTVLSQRNQIAQRLEADRRALQVLVERIQGPAQPGTR